MLGNAAGVWSASLWKSTILPFFILLVTRLQMLSGVAESFQSRESTLDIKVILLFLAKKTTGFKLLLYQAKYDII